MSRLVVSAEQRDALYVQIATHLSGIDDLPLAVEEGDFEKADRLAREFSGDLRLVAEDLGWGDSRGSEPIELTLPPAELRQILERLRDRAASQHEAEREEQEALKARWDRATLVQATCEQVLRELNS